MDSNVNSDNENFISNLQIQLKYNDNNHELTPI